MLPYILNNGGSTIKRLINDKTADYNDVTIHEYSATAQVFKPAHKAQYFEPIKTAGELTALVGNPMVRGNDCFAVI